MDDWGWALIFLGVGVVVGFALALKTQPQTKLSTKVEPTFYENEDVYEWVDWNGKPRKLVRHRKIKIV